MNSPHGRSDQTLDMASVVFAAKRAILDSNTPIFAGRFEGVAVELLGIVDVNRLRDAGRRPNQFFQCPGTCTDFRRTQWSRHRAIDKTDGSSKVT